MRNSFKLIAAGVAILATALACNKEQTEPAPQEPEFVTLNFEADGNLANTDTKTVLDSPDDKGIYHVSWNQTGESFHVFESRGGKFWSVSSNDNYTIDSEGKISFTANIEKDENGSSFVYSALYPASRITDNDGTGNVIVNTPSLQNPSLTSFDPDADLLISKPSEEYTTQQTAPISFQFARMVSLTMMNIKGLETTDPVVSITFTAEGKQIAGSCKYDITKVSRTEAVETQNSITLNYDKDLNFTNNCTAYMYSLPMTINVGESFRVDVVTENASGVQTLYRKDVTVPEAKGNMTFEAGGAVKFGVNFTGITGLKFFRKVTSEPADWSGTYLIVREDDTNYIYDGSLDDNGLKSNNNAKEISIYNSSIIATEEIKSRTFIIAKYDAGYSLMSASNIYISKTTGKYGVDTGQAVAHTISLTSRKNAEIKCGDYTLKYNTATNSFFKYYQSETGNVIQLYKLEE